MAKASEFFKKVKGDKALQEKIKGIKKSAMEKIIAVAKEEGFELKPDDFGKGELSDADLEKVAAAGGGSRGDCKTGYAPLY